METRPRGAHQRPSISIPSEPRPILVKRQRGGNQTRLFETGMTYPTESIEMAA